MAAHGDIPSNIALAAGESLRRNAGDSAFEAYTPATLDATLTAFAALTIVANSMTVGTGTDTFSQLTIAANQFLARASTGDLTQKTITDFGFSFLDDADGTAGLTTLGLSANGRSLVTAADYSAMRTLLGLVIGTNVQAYDADLTTWAGLTPSANAQSLVTAADYSAMRTLLGLVIGTNVQAYDADLTTWAGLTPSANAQSLVTAANYAAMRTLLTLVPGTDVQAYDATLAALAGLTIAANSLSIGSGTDAFTQTTFAANTFPGRSSTGNLIAKTITDFGFSFLDDADGTAGLTTLGLSANGRSLVTAADYSAMRTLLGLVIGTNVQAYDADLTTWAGLTPSANAQSLVTAADYSAMRTLLGLVIGTNVQAYDADLAALAGVTSAADKMPYFTGSGTATTATVTSFARTVLDDTDAATARATLEAQKIGIPQSRSVSSTLTFASTDNGAHILHPGTDTTARNWTIPSGLAVGTTITIVNAPSAGVISIVPSGVTLYRDGTAATGTRTLAACSTATIICYDTNIWMISGGSTLT